MNQYLEKIASFEKQALRRIISELAKGKVSMKLSELVQKGFIKSKKVYSKGTKEGNTNLASKLEFKINKPRNLRDESRAKTGEGYLTLPKQPNEPRRPDLILADRKNSELFPTKHDHNNMVRHELLEAMEVKESRKAGTMIDWPDKSRTPPISMFSKETLPGKHLSKAQHFSPRVLARESEMVRKNPHLSAVFKRIRNSSGEANTIERLTGKKYGSDKITSKDLLRAHTSPPDAWVNKQGIPTKVFKEIKE